MKRSFIGNAVLLGGRLATSQKSRFQAAKRSNMSSSILQESRFADVQVLRFEAGKPWDMGSAKLQEGRFADIQESRFQFAKIFKYVYCRPEKGSISYFAKITFSGLRNVKKCAVPCYKYDLLMISICVFSVRKSRCGHWWHERTSICWCLGTSFSGLGTSHWLLLSCIVVNYLMYRISVSNCQMLWHILRNSARGSVWWCYGIAF